MSVSDVTLTDNTEQIKKLLKENIILCLTGIGKDTRGRAIDNYTRFPRVDTGLLRDSINFEVEDSEQAVYIGTNVKYAVYVEMGTTKMIASWCLKRSVTEHENEIRESIKEAIDFETV